MTRKFRFVTGIVKGVKRPDWIAKIPNEDAPGTFIYINANGDQVNDDNKSETPQNAMDKETPGAVGDLTH